MKELMEKYNNKIKISKIDDELLKYKVECNEGYILDGECKLGKYDDELFVDTIHTKIMHCYNLREVKSVLKTLKEL